jgi:hypothetical protein
VSNQEDMASQSQPCADASALALKALRAAAEKATPGPWKTSFSVVGRVIAENGAVIASCTKLTSVSAMEDNARFIVAACNAVPELIALHAALVDERDYAVAEMKNAQAYWRAETNHAEQAEARATSAEAQLTVQAELIAQRAALAEYYEANEAVRAVGRFNSTPEQYARLTAARAAASALEASTLQSKGG